MKKRQIPGKIGTVYQKPAWRYDALFHPKPYKLQHLLSKSGHTSKRHLRLIPLGVKLKWNYSLPKFVLDLFKQLTFEEAELLLALWKRHLKQTRQAIFVENKDRAAKIVSWNLKRLDEIEDVWLRKLVAHAMNYEYDENVDFALKMHHLPENREIKRFMGFCIFAGISDKEIAKRWRIFPVSKIEALRNIFFDFSSFPTDPVAKWSLLRQLVKTGDIELDDFPFYKRIFDLGELGLKAQVSFLHLKPMEQQAIERYIGKTAIISAFNLDFNIRNAEDIYAYTKMINNMAKNQLQYEMVKQKAAEIELTKLQIEQMKRNMNVDNSSITDEDKILIREFSEKLNKLAVNPEYVDFSELVKEERV